MTFFPWDEINILEEKAESVQTRAQSGDSSAVDNYIDEVTELFEMDYMLGVQDVSAQLGVSIDPNYRQMAEALTRKFDGKTYVDRITAYAKSGTPYDIARVIATDAHRIYNAAMFDSAKNGGATTKTWRTMQDPRVRDTHDYLEGTTIGIDDEFYTYNGNHAYYPSQFGVAEEDINCRCWVTFSK